MVRPPTFPYLLDTPRAADKSARNRAGNLGSNAGNAAPPGARRGARNARGAMDFLHAHDGMATLLPAVVRMSSLQQDCQDLLPAGFAACEVLLYEADKLVLAVPGAALASKLKQMLPRLQDSLQKRGWQVSAIKLKVQVRQYREKEVQEKQLSIPAKALDALDELEKSLPQNTQTDDLRAALRHLVARHRKS